MRLPKFILLAVFLLVFSVNSVIAAGFQLRTVGDMSVDGVTYDQLWYTGTSVTFTGIATANATVTATIDGNTENVTADASGNWSYSTTLTEGDHAVSFTSNESTISLTLTIGTVPEGVGGLTATSTPTVGTIHPTIMVLSSGLALLVFGFVLKKAKLLSI